MHYDEVFRHIGEFGRYQKFLYCLICLPWIFCGMQTFLTVFILHVPDHRCAPINAIVEEFKHVDIHRYLTSGSNVIPSQSQNQENHGIYLKCDIVFKHRKNHTIDIDNVTFYDKEKCKQWAYDKDQFDLTFAMQANLVCDKKGDRTHAVMSFMAGLTAGALITGFISDIFGRKTSFMLSITLITIPNICLTFVEEYLLFVAIRFVSGFAVSGLLGTGFVMGMELVGPTKRCFAGIVFEFFWAFGSMVLALLAYLIRDWRHLNLAVSVPPVLFFSYLWILPESPRWLLNKGRRKEAEEILLKTARLNKRDEVPRGKLTAANSDKKQQEIPLRKACTHPKLMYQLATIFFGWMVVSMVFYGLAMNSGNIEGSLFLNYFMSSLAELIGFAGCLSALYKVGRRYVFTVSILLSGVACILTIFPVLYASIDLQWIAVVLSAIGKVFASSAFAVMFLYSGEIFPTVIRNSALGIAAVFARVGGMIAPYIIDIAVHMDNTTGKAIPLIVFGVTGLLAGIMALKLPETKDVALPETIEDWLNLGKNQGVGFELQISSSESLRKSDSTKRQSSATEEEQTDIHLLS